MGFFDFIGKIGRGIGSVFNDPIGKLKSMTGGITNLIGKGANLISTVKKGADFLRNIPVVGDFVKNAPVLSNIGNAIDTADRRAQQVSRLVNTGNGFVQGL
jgi:hypothetical protein